MNWKEFLKPTKGKAVLIIVLLVWIIIYDSFAIDGALRLGFPFIFYISQSLPCPITEQCTEFYFNFLVIDIIIDYLLACLIILGYDKVKK